MSWIMAGSRIEKNQAWAFLGLFGSVGTLICCVLPVSLVMLGMGSVVVTLFSKVPALIWISAHKDLVFSLSGGMIFLSGWALYLGRNQPCPIDPDLRQACLKGRKYSRWIYFFSLTLFSIGFFTTYLLPLFL